MELTLNSNIGKLVAIDYRTAVVFRELDIDFCCQGNRSIADACTERQIDPNKLIDSLAVVMRNSNKGTTDFTSWPLDLLADYVEKKHHRYVQKQLPVIKDYLSKIAKVHGARHPELLEIAQLFDETAAELTAHMKKEELMLFPFIRKMVMAQLAKQTLPLAPFGTIQNPVQMMLHDHDAEGDRFRKIAKLSNNYTPPNDACNTYKLSFSLLKEFEEDLHLHIHLENNILFPKSVELEKELQNDTTKTT